MPLGTQLTMSGAAGQVTLTVVGIADSVDSSADGWVLPSEIAKLRAPGTPPPRRCSTGSATRAAPRPSAPMWPRSPVRCPRGRSPARSPIWPSRRRRRRTSRRSCRSWSPSPSSGWSLSALIVANVVSGAVVAGYRRIGVLKSIGFSPGQVVAAYTGQAMVPAIAGCLGGVVLGNLLAAPVLGQTANVYGVGALRVPGLGGPGRPARPVLPDRDRRAAARAAGGPVQRGPGDRRRARAAHRPWLRRAPAAGQARAAPAGDDRARGPVRPPGPHRDHADRRAARRDRGDVRGGPERVAEPGRGRPQPRQRRAGAGVHTDGRPRRRPHPQAERESGNGRPRSGRVVRPGEAALAGRGGTDHHHRAAGAAGHLALRRPGRASRSA